MFNAHMQSPIAVRATGSDVRVRAHRSRGGALQTARQAEDPIFGGRSR